MDVSFRRLSHIIEKRVSVGHRAGKVVIEGAIVEECPESVVFRIELLLHVAHHVGELSCHLAHIVERTIDILQRTVHINLCLFSTQSGSIGSSVVEVCHHHGHILRHKTIQTCSGVLEVLRDLRSIDNRLLELCRRR